MAAAEQHATGPPAAEGQAALRAVAYGEPSAAPRDPQTGSVAGGPPPGAASAPPREATISTLPQLTTTPHDQVAITIWHSRTSRFSTWNLSDPMEKVFTFFIPAEATHDPELVLEEAFETFNIGQTALARDYFSRRLRTLSVGDVVAIGESAWACDSVGWRLLRQATTEG